MLTFIMLGALTVGLPAPAPSLLVTTARQTRAVVVDGDRVEFGDLSPTAPRALTHVDIAPAPSPGKSTTVSRTAVAAALRRAGAEPTLANGLPSRQTVVRASVRVGVDDLRQDIRAAVAPRLPVGVEVQTVVGLRPVVLPPGVRRVDVDFTKLRSATRATVRVFVGQRLWHQSAVTLNLRGQAQAPTLRRNMPRGATIGSGDVELAPAALEQLPRGAALRRNHLVGRRLTQPGRAGKPVQRAAVATPPTVERGREIFVVAQTRGLRISRAAVALQDGRLGQMINVRPRDGGKTLRAEVVSATEVRISIGGSR